MNPRYPESQSEALTSKLHSPIENKNIFIKKDYKNKIKNAIINAKSAIASVKANPKIAYLKRSSFKEGFLAKASNREPKIAPIPTPAPAKPKVDRPAPIFFAAVINVIKYL